MKKIIFNTVFLTIIIFFTASDINPAFESDLFKSYISNPDRHPNIPNNSFAGYSYGEKNIPVYPVVGNVIECGAKADGKTDCSKAFNQAIFLVHQKGGGAVLIPQGTYILDDEVWMLYDNIVLRGEGTGKTVIKINKPLSETYKGRNEKTADKNSEWLNCGGFIWFDPENESEKQRIVQGWKMGGNDRAETESGIGDSSIRVTDGANFAKGRKIIIYFEDDKDKTFQRSMFRDLKLARGCGWDEWSRIAGKIFKSNFQYTAEIAGVNGNEIILRQPLRLPVPKGTRIMSIKKSVENSGIENLTIWMKGNDSYKHHQEKGYNAVYFDNAWNCWVSGVEIINWENGVAVWFSKNITIRNLSLKGNGRHTGVHFARSSDCLLYEFEIDSALLHGITFDSFSCGNVCTKGLMKHGCFDYHRSLAFDNIFTEIGINNDGTHGGENAPRFGARDVHWNITVTNGRSYMICPSNLMPYGAAAGIRGCDIYKEQDADYEGDVKTAIEAQGKNIMPENLYLAQLKLRLGYIPDHLK